MPTDSKDFRVDGTYYSVMDMIAKIGIVNLLHFLRSVKILL
jgi:hypothetical protein